MAQPNTCSEIALNLTAAITAVMGDEVYVLTLEGSQLPFGSFSPDSHRTLELALRGWVLEQTGLSLGYVEQLYTFGNRHRDPELGLGRNHQITVGYLALVPSTTFQPSLKSEWVPWYQFLPWEDHRENSKSGNPGILQKVVLPELETWINEGASPALQQARRERVITAFGDSRVPWDNERTILRYELLYEAGIVFESSRDWNAYPEDERDQLPITKLLPVFSKENSRNLGKSMKQDHRRILASSIGRIRGKLKYRPVVFELLPEEFTLLNLQKVVEALSGTTLHKQNFRRLMIQGGLVKPTGQKSFVGPGRPAELFRYRRSILAERPAPSWEDE